MDVIQAIWLATLLIAVLVIVPLAVLLLHRTLRAAISIRRYLDEMLAAGVGIAGHTAAITALDDTIKTATTMVGVAGDIKSHSGTIASVLAQRAAQEGAA
jgi:hypothetical protein